MTLPSKGKPQRIRDPLHDLIEFDDGPFEQMLWNVIQSRPFQRLRRIRQLGFSEFVFPGATHSRFIHSVGVFHNARRLMRIIERYLGRDFEPRKAEAALAAALLHDIGHGPFSHSFEAAGEQAGHDFARHESVGEAIVMGDEIAPILDGHQPGLASQVANVIGARHPADVYSSVVSSQFDADRLDYMQRDRLMTGTQHGAIDLTWLTANLEVARIPIGDDERGAAEIETFVLSPKAFHAAQTYVIGLFQLYPTVYFHKTTRAAEKVFQSLFARVIGLVQNGDGGKTGLAHANPIIRFASAPGSPESVLNLDDAVIWGALPEMREASDDSVRSLAGMLLDRELLKTVDIRSSVGEELGAKGARSETLEKAVNMAKTKLQEQVRDAKDGLPEIWIDNARRSPYKEREDGASILNQILIKQNGKPIDLKEISPVVESVPVFELDRVCYRKDHDETRDRIIDAIKQSCKEARKE